jgi:histidinol dehydrogenase
MPLFDSSDPRARVRVFEGRTGLDARLLGRVARIVDAVRRRGDAALVAYARRFDGVDPPLELSRAEIEAGARAVPPALRAALAAAARHIRRVAVRQRPRPWRLAVTRGVVIEQRVTPLDRVACYVPGGRFPLPSTVLMTVVPARVAGVGEIVVACPRPTPAVLAAAIEAGATRVFRLGGAHAIAALAYGTETVPRVDKIVGPGSLYVAAAKRQVAADCGVDLHAGPTEIVVVAERGPADWIAADLVAQAEHDPDARAVLLTPNRRLAAAVQRRVAARGRLNPAARAALARRGALVVTRDLEEAVAWAVRLAPEHLLCDTRRVARRVTTAGTVFVGPYAAPAAGDYATGSNHVLPTGGWARLRGGLSTTDFVRVSTVQRLTRRGLAALGPTVVTLARAEGLLAHAASVEARLGARGSERRR